jgi:hypothetical protein
MNEFGVGDKVAAISHSQGWGNVTKGDIGTIAYFSGDSISVNFPFQLGWICLKSNLELVEAASSIVIEQIPTKEEEALAAAGQAIEELQNTVTELIIQNDSMKDIVKMIIDAESADITLRAVLYSVWLDKAKRVLL